MARAVLLKLQVAADTSNLIQQLLIGAGRSVRADPTAAGVAARMSLAIQLTVLLRV
jgi:hypothetical protein